MMGAFQEEVQMRRQVKLPYRQVVVACVCAMVLVVAIRAQQAPTANLVPVSVSSLLLHPETYLNQTVSVYGPVEQLLTATAFSMDQDASKPALTDLLVLAPTLNEPPKTNAYLTVVGVVIQFDPAEIQQRAKEYSLDLPPNVAERYRGKVMVLATSVVDPDLVDLAKVLPKPMTPEEEAFDKIMKQVNPANGELRKGVEASDKAMVTTQAALLKNLFGDTRKFFESRGTADAVGWASDAVALLATIEKSAGANQWDDVTASSAKLAPLCQSCHAAYRERQEDGTYRVKK
jgi:cytochrome c556